MLVILVFVVFLLCLFDFGDFVWLGFALVNCCLFSLFDSVLIVLLLIVCVVAEFLLFLCC